MTILVTGIAGFIGSHVAKTLLERGDTVIGIDNFNDYYDPRLKEDRVKTFLKDHPLVLYRIDVTDINSLEKVFCENKIDKICHLAAQAGVRYSLEHPEVYLQTNIVGTNNMLEMAKKYEVKDFVFASSSSVYGGNKKFPFSETDPVDRPISIYAATKRANELQAYTYHHLFGINCFGLRFFTAYGPWGRPDMALFKFARLINDNKPIDVYNNGKHRRGFTYVDDIVDGVLRSLDRCRGYGIFNLGGGRVIDLEYFIKLIESGLGKSAEKNYLPLQQGDVPETSADISKAKELLGYEPKTDIEEGIEKSLDWYKEYYG